MSNPSPLVQGVQQRDVSVVARFFSYPLSLLAVLFMGIGGAAIAAVSCAAVVGLFVLFIALAVAEIALVVAVVGAVVLLCFVLAFVISIFCLGHVIWRKSEKLRWSKKSDIS